MGKYEYQIFCSIGGCFGTGRMWRDNTPNPEMLQGANFVATGFDNKKFSIKVIFFTYFNGI